MGNPPGTHERGTIQETGKPVKFLFDDSHPYVWDCIGGDLSAKVGYNNDGQIIAVESIGTSDYRYMVSMGAVDKMKIHSNIPNIYQKNTMPYRNKASSCTMRDGGGPVGFANFVYQRVAAALGKDPTEIALINNGSDGSKQNYEEAVADRRQAGRDSLKECIAAGKEAFGWDEKWHEPGSKKLASGKMHGVAFTWAEEWSHRPMYTQAQITVGFDGKVKLTGRRIDTGSDCRNAYARVVADEMGVKIEDVNVDLAHNDGTVQLACPAGSGGMYKSGMAIIDAAQKARRQIFEMATSTGSFEGLTGLYLAGKPIFAGLSADDLDMKNGLVFLKADPSKAMPLAQIAFFFEGAYGAEYYRAGQIDAIGTNPG
jgi:CO/xanthine dehydrogenase Mo-binding subunit